MYREVSECRICGNATLIPLLNLGEQCLTGVFPKTISEKVSSGPLELVKCHPAREGDKVCHLVQLAHSYDSSQMYGMNYGYRSGLNRMMVNHLRSIVSYVQSFVNLSDGDMVVDIGSNDSTLLQQYSTDRKLNLVGIDPTGMKFKSYYPPHIGLIPEFFSAEAVQKAHGGKKAKIITSIAMFYDLEDPLAFVRQVHDSLTDDGIWVFEMSYLPSMLDTTAYDTVCHEHVEYYALRQIRWLLDRAGFRVVDTELNDTNGGSFRIAAVQTGSAYETRATVAALEENEDKLRLDLAEPYAAFSSRVVAHKKALVGLLSELRKQGKKTLGYGASTKGNVILQYCGLGVSDVPCIAEVNSDKFGSYTPSTLIPIVSEEEAKAMNPDYFLVLPWHFRDEILRREREFIARGGRLIFPLPKIDITSE